MSRLTMPSTRTLFSFAALTTNAPVTAGVRAAQINMKPRDECQVESLLESERAKSQRSAGMVGAIRIGLGLLIVTASILLSIFLASELYAESDFSALILHVATVAFIFGIFWLATVNYGKRRNSQSIIRIGVVGAMISTVVAVSFIVSAA